MFPKGLAQTGQTPKARNSKEDLCVKKKKCFVLNSSRSKRNSMRRKIEAKKMRLSASVNTHNFIMVINLL